MSPLALERRENDPARWLKARIALVAMVFFFFLLAVLGRAAKLQISDRGKLLEMAKDQYVRQIDVPARRGEIFDRRGVPLAQSVEVESIWADPSMIPDLSRAAGALARRLQLDPSDLRARLNQEGRRFVWIKRQVKPQEAMAVRRLHLPGIQFTPEPRRFYPQRELAAHVLGLVGTDGKGLDGLELSFDAELSGERVQFLGLRDARGRKLLVEGAAEPPERQGASLYLTLDRRIEQVTEQALGRAVEKSKAASGMAVVLDPGTGEILALASHPPFNPNDPKGYGGALRDRAALDAFEPGSTFKAFAVAAALEEKAIRPQDPFYCEKGAWDIGRHTIHDTHPYGWLSPARILQVSSNIGAAKIVQALGKDRWVDYVTRFGFGEKTGLGLSGEPKGQVPYPKADVALATQAFGQGLTATAVQIAAAYGALANGGTLLRPYLVAKVVDPDGVVVLENRPAPVRRVVSEKVARQVVSMLEGVVAPSGTAPLARMAEYRVAGKTGTAQKVDPVAKGYSNKRIASFVGMVPAQAPRLVILIVVDEPKIDVYGGLVAAPAFKEIGQEVLPYLGVPSSKGAKEPSPPDEAQEPAAIEVAAGPETVVPDPVTEAVGNGGVEVPDLTGRVGREAVAQLLANALEPRVLGSGRVVSQSPPPKVHVEKGSPVTIRLGAWE